MRHRTDASSPPPASSSSDDEDAFSALSKKRKKKTKAPPNANSSNKAVKTEEKEQKPAAAAAAADANNDGDKQKLLPVYNTSSMKRHHGAASDTRKAKLDAILLELEAEKDHVKKEPARGGRNCRKRGSYVDEGDEFVTTNVFVGNLAPSITEEQMAELFRQFGENDSSAMATLVAR